VTEQATTQSTEIGRLADEIAKIRVRLNTFWEDSQETIQRAREASTPMVGEALVIAAQDQVARAEVTLKQQLSFKYQQLENLRSERKNLLRDEQVCRRFIAENESEVAGRYERALALMEQLTKLLNRDIDSDFEALELLRGARGKIGRLPTQLREHRNQLDYVIRRLAELGE
jgi:hypothetical protein